MTKRLAPVFVLAVCATACDSPTQQTQPSARQAANAIVASATGGGWIEFGIPGLSDAQFSFSAVQHADGTASGVFHQVRSNAGLTIDFSGEVTCLSVDPVNHRAWIGGVIRANNSTSPAFQVDTLHAPGLDVWFRVVDYGEGDGAPNDRSTTYGFKHSAGILTSAEYCATMPWPADDARTFPVVSGNVQVRP
jgi:hypothetical protein